MDYKNSSNTIFDIEKLIESVRKRECLYSKHHIKYRNRDYVHKMWSEIAQEIGHSEKICKDKWANLRSNYQRELRKFKTRDPSTKPWPYLNTLRFLDPYLESREFFTMTQFSEETKSEDAINAIQNVVETLTIPIGPSELQLSPISSNKLRSSRKRKKLQAADTQFLEELQRIRGSLENKFNDFNIDDDTCFLLSLRSSLAALSSANNMIFRIECQKLIQQLIIQSNNDIKGFHTFP